MYTIFFVVFVLYAGISYQDRLCDRQFKLLVSTQISHCFVHQSRRCYSGELRTTQFRLRRNHAEASNANLLKACTTYSRRVDHPIGLHALIYCWYDSVGYLYTSISTAVIFTGNWHFWDSAYYEFWPVAIERFMITSGIKTNLCTKCANCAVVKNKNDVILPNNVTVCYH
jgi:hypothetical protein